MVPLVQDIDPRLYVSISTIPEAGYGVFARRHLAEGEQVFIRGVAVRRGSMEEASIRASRHYFFYWPSQDAVILPVGYGALINHTSDRRFQNVRIAEHEGRVFYEVIRGIGPGEELLGNYGYSPPGDSLPSIPYRTGVLTPPGG